MSTQARQMDVGWQSSQPVLVLRLWRAKPGRILKAPRIPNCSVAVWLGTEHGMILANGSVSRNTVRIPLRQST